jgi:hypothetical protein
MTLTTGDVLGNVGTTGHGLDSTVFIEFQSGQQTGDAATVNRIMLRCTGIGIATNKRANAQPIPFSGIVTGESRSIVLDLGMVSKSVQLDGVIHEQVISRRHADEGAVHRVMTAYEIAQLLHSSVDSSFAQEHQNLDTLYILYPSRVGDNYDYHTSDAETDEHSELPLIPFTWASRTLDKAGTISALASNFPDASTALTEINGISGFIDQFTTQFQPGGLVTFNLSFNETVNLSLS